MPGWLQTQRITGPAPAGGYASAGIGQWPGGPLVRFVIGGPVGGLHYAPDTDDLIVSGKGAGLLDLPLGFYLDPALAYTLAPTLQPGQVALLHKSGSSVVLNADGSISLLPAAGKQVLLGPSGSPISRSGDAVQVSGNVPSGGGNVTLSGTITGAGSAYAKA